MKLFFTFLLIVVGITYSTAATFTSKVTGFWSTKTTWDVTAGVDADSIPDLDDDVVVLSGHTINLVFAVNSCKTLNVNAGGILNGNTKKFRLKGSLTNLGSIVGNIELFFQATGTLTSASTFTCKGYTWVQNNNTVLTIAPGTVINKIGQIYLQNSNTKVINNGSVTLKNLVGSTSVTGTIKFIQSTGTGGTFTNASGSFLSIQSDFTFGAAVNTINFSSPTNTLTCTGTASNVISTTYGNLTLSTISRTLTSNLKVLKNLALGVGGALSSNGHSIRVGGDLANTATITFLPGDTIIFNGTSATAQAISGTSTLFSNLEVNNTGGGGVIFNSTQSITNDLIMTKGNCNSNSKLILQSDAASTARIATITNTAVVSFSGNMIMQKYIQGFNPYNYFDLSSPAQSSTVSDWDNEMFISGIGVYDGIGGPAGVDGDVFNSAPSMNTYDEPTNAFVPVTGSATALVPGTGYDMLFCDNNFISWYAKTIDTRGIPNYGDITLAGLTYNAGMGDGWHLVGNPYACHIDYASVTKLRMTSNIYFTDGGNYSAWPNGTSIPPHQGFYVETTPSALAHSITFTEACKEINHTAEFYRTRPNYDIKLNVNSQLTPFSHENTINFNSLATVKYDEEFDATYRKFPLAVAPAIYMIDKTINKNMIRNVVNSNDEELTIPLGVFTPKAGMYNIDASILNMDAYNYAWIENTKTGIKYDLNSSVAIEGTELGTNTNYVLRLSKTKKSASISETILQSDLVIFNTENTINLKSTNSNHALKEVTVFDMTGKLMLTQPNVYVEAGNITKIDISALTSGIYVVNVIDEQGRSVSKKLVK